MTLFAGFMQICWVVTDLDDAVRRWQKTTGAGPFFCMRSPPVGNFHYRGRPANLDMDVALAQAGDVQIELICPKGDLPSAYRDSCEPGSEVMHHLGKFSNDYDRDYEALASQGFIEAQSGLSGTARFAYFDTRSTMGCMIELIEQDDNLRTLFQMISDAAKDWNGDDPFRELTFS